MAVDDATVQTAFVQMHPISPEQVVAATEVVAAHAKDRDDLRELLDALGLNQGPRTTPSPALKKASVPTPTTTDVPINTRGDA
jgi:hypothetical protein